MTDFLDLAKRRFSARKYLDKKVEREKLDVILEAGRVAPTTENGQPQRILVVEDEQGLIALESCGNPYRAPLAFVICADVGDSFHDPETNRDSYEVDAVIVATHMMLAAADQDLGSIWIGQFDRKSIRRSFNVPEEWAIVCILLIGYADCESDMDRHRTARRPLEETVFYGSF